MYRPVKAGELFTTFIFDGKDCADMGVYSTTSSGTYTMYIEDVNRTLTIDDEIIVADMKDISAEEAENFFVFCENIGFEENYVTYAKYKEFMHKYKINNLSETEGLIERQRMIKTPEEIEKIKKFIIIPNRLVNIII